ncbi:glycine betaine ABC transporter substrate-binding protein [Georgenia deserti]|uniref:Glycine betaine ABC transporter substrate-binding protein n=1 Tax=Georgenia deserti TaxID=2093781 RepID=A0ABW4L4B9_9MICO
MRDMTPDHALPGSPQRRPGSPRVSRRGVLSAAVGAAGLAALGGCGMATGKGEGTVTVGSKGFAESWINGELYAQALRALGYQVDLKTNVGSSELIDAALTSGQIDLYPEYTGVIVMSLAGHEDLMESAEQTLDLAREFEASRGVTVLDATPFENKNAIAVTREFAARHNLRTIDDLRGIGEFTYSTYPDNVSGGQGYEAIVETYRLPNMNLRTLSIGLNYQALENGEIDAADVFTTDPQLLRSDLVVLEDTKNLFGFQNVVPCVRDDLLDRVGQDVPDLLNTMSSLLTLEAVQAMNEASAINRLDPAQVARRFLEANDLL